MGKTEKEYCEHCIHRKVCGFKDDWMEQSKYLRKIFLEIVEKYNLVEITDIDDVLKCKLYLTADINNTLKKDMYEIVGSQVRI